MLVYVAIAVSGVALLALAVGALVKRKELFGPSTSAEPQLARPESAALYVPPLPQAVPQAAPWQGTGPASPAWPAATPQPQPQTQPVPVPGRGPWEWPPDAPATQEMPRISSVPAPASAAPQTPPAPPAPPPNEDQPAAEAEPPVPDAPPAAAQRETH